jgi:hypothetical protein
MKQEKEELKTLESETEKCKEKIKLTYVSHPHPQTKLFISSA